MSRVIQYVSRLFVLSLYSLYGYADNENPHTMESPLILQEHQIKYINYLFLLLFFFCSLPTAYSLQYLPPHRRVYNFQHIQPHEVANNYQLLKLTDAVLNKHQITYWAWAGTLLGAVRHRGFIPWDLDTDICIFAEDEEKLFECAADFAIYDAYIQPCSGTKTHYRVKRVKDGKELFGHVDVFFMKNIQGKIHYIFDVEQQDNHFFWPSELERLVRIPFGPIFITAPEEPMAYLYRGYGNDVMEMAQIMYTNNPRTGKPYSKFKLPNFRAAIYEVIDFSIPLDDSPWFYN